MVLNSENPTRDGYLKIGKEVLFGIVMSVASFLSIMFVPLVGVLIGAFTPLATSLFYYRWGRPKGYLVPAGAIVIGGAVLSYIGASPAIPYFAGMLTMGMLLGLGVRRRWSLESTAIGSILPVFLTGALSFWLIYGGAEGGAVKSLEADLKNAVDLAIRQYAPNPEERRLFEENLQGAVPIVVPLLPGIAFSCCLVLSWLNLVAVRRYGRLRRLSFPPWDEWPKWKAPESLVWGVIGSGFAYFVPSESVRAAAMNALIILGTVYFLQGMSISAFYFERWNVPRFFRGILYAFLSLQFFTALALALVGLFDMWFDFRRLTRKPVEPPIV